MNETQNNYHKPNDTSNNSLEPSTSTPPTEEEIDQTFDLIQDRLEEVGMNLALNIQVKRGYEAALDILEGVKDASDINEIQGVQASAIASLAVDYLLGDCSQKILLGVPLKGSTVKPTIN